METGQRIATTLDKERIGSVATSAFAQVCQADAVLLFSLVDGELVHTSTRGAEEELEIALLAALREAVITGAAVMTPPGGRSAST